MSRVGTWTSLSNRTFNDGTAGATVGSVPYVVATNSGGGRLYRLSGTAWPQVTFDISATTTPQGMIGRSDGKLIVVGTSGAVFTYDPDAQTKDDGTVLTAWPRPRSYAASVVAGTKLYLIGGRVGSGALLDYVDIYDVEAGTWSTGTALSTAAFKGAGVERGGNIYFWGASSLTFDTVALKYVPSTGVWSTITTSLVTFQQGIALALEDGPLVLLHPGFNGQDGTTYIYNTDLDETSTLNVTAPSYLDGDLVGGVSLDGVPYIFGYGGGAASASASFALRDPTSDVPFLVANDRYQTIALPVRGTTTTTAEFRYWSVAAPYWSETLSSTSSIPTFFTFDELGSPTSGSLELPYRQMKPGMLAAVDGIVVRFIPRPSSLSEGAGTNSTVTFIARVEGHGLSSYDRTTPNGSSGVAVSESVLYTDAGNTQDATAWPNIRTVYVPVRMDTHVRAARVVLSDIALCEIVPPVELIGSVFPMREV